MLSTVYNLNLKFVKLTLQCEKCLYPQAARLITKLTKIELRQNYDLGYQNIIKI